VHYDSLLAKLIAHAPTRAEAIAAAAAALDDFAITGVQHNLGFLAALMAHPRWRAGALSTDFLAEEFAAGFVPPAPTGAAALVFAAVAAALCWPEANRRRPGVPLPTPVRQWVVEVAGTSFAVRVAAAGEGLSVDFASGEALRLVSAWRPGMAVWEGQVDGLAVAFRLDGCAGAWRLEHGGFAAEVCVRTPAEAALARRMPAASAAAAGPVLRAPMPGLVRAVRVAPGQSVAADEPLLVLEAMKVELTLRAPGPARVRAIRAEVGTLVAADAVLLEFG
jgi:propionyl-CoA carboxylase alpha chain